MNWYKKSSTVNTEDAMDHVIKSIEYLLTGQWNITSARKLRPPWTYQMFSKVKLEGRDVNRVGDIYEVFVTIFVLKKPKSHSQNIDIEREVPDWVKDKTQWHDVSTFDSEEGHELLEFYVHIRGSATGEKEEENMLGQTEFEYIGDSREELGRAISTPYEVAVYTKEAINNNYRRGDNDNDDGDEPEFDYDPQGVGVETNELV